MMILFAWKINHWLMIDIFMWFYLHKALLTTTVIMAIVVFVQWQWLQDGQGHLLDNCLSHWHLSGLFSCKLAHSVAIATTEWTPAHSLFASWDQLRVAVTWLQPWQGELSCFKVQPLVICNVVPAIITGWRRSMTLKKNSSTGPLSKYLR